LGASGCSRVRLVYGSADLLLASYADDYLGLQDEQRQRWEPQLRGVLAEHRREGLPQLAAFFDQGLKVSQAGFPSGDTACLVRAARGVYQDHARLAVELAAPLLADLRPSQVKSLRARFARDQAEDRAEAAGDLELHRRTQRYVRAIEDWTGPLGPDQRALVSETTGRMPDTRQAVLAYRTRKRDQLIALLEAGADAQRLKGYLTTWLVDYEDLPPGLEGAGEVLEEHLVELATRLGQGLTQKQRAHLERRLSGLCTDLLELQSQPRLAPLGC
jgi:hypothetical protein